MRDVVLEDRGSWPFTGRDAELGLIRRRLGTAGRGLVVVADAGAGRTRLVAEAAPGAAWVTGTEAGVGIPFGAFAHLLPVGLPVGQARAGGLRWAAQALVARRDPAPLVVDDAHLLDPASAALVHHLVRATGVKVLVTVRAEAPAPDAIGALWRQDLLPRIDLQPYGPAELAELLGRALGGHVEARTVRRLHEAVRGNLVLLRELVAAGLAGGTLSLTDGLADDLWSWPGEFLVTGRVRDVVESAIGELDDAERETLELLAFGEPLDVDVLAGLAGAGAVERLEARGLVSSRRSGRGFAVRTVNRLYAQVIRGWCGELRTRRIKLRLAAAVGGDRLRTTVWRLDAGCAVAPADLVEACRLAWASYDTTLAERLGRAALAAECGPAAVLALGSALSLTGRPPELDALLTGLSAGLATDRDRATYAVSHAYAAAFGNTCPAGPAAQIDDPGWRQYADSATAVLDAYAGTVTAERLAEIRALADPGPVVTARLATAEALRLAAAGQTRRSLAVAEDVLTGPQPDPALPLPLTSARLTACLAAGDLDRAWATVATGARLIGEEATWDTGLAGLYGHRAQVCRLRGEVADALTWSRDGVLRLRGRVSGFAGLCLGELAQAAALTGDLPTARRALERAKQQAVTTFRTVDFAADAALPQVMAAAGDRAGAIRAALAVADRAARLGFAGHELFALHDVVRFGGGALAVDRLEELADRIDGALAPVFARHAAGQAAGDPAALEAVAKELAELGMLLLAAEAQAQAALGYRELADPRRARGAETLAWALAGDCQGARTLALAGLIAPELTARQHEIAQLAAAGLTNRQIAARLCISVRTAANHLCAVYERLGVSDRADLTGRLNHLAGA
jgi:DNA-binding CsgD family transcriptional regulator